MSVLDIALAASLPFGGAVALYVTFRFTRKRRLERLSGRGRKPATGQR